VRLVRFRRQRIWLGVNHIWGTSGSALIIGLFDGKDDFEMGVRDGGIVVSVNGECIRVGLGWVGLGS
jgi:hypothetical protein